MPNFTKKAIMSSFWKLLNERPLNQITVKDIVEDCGINRNSFYYHYQDLPSLIEEIVEDLIKQTIDEHPTISTFEECLNVVVNMVMDNKKAVFHIYNSVDHRILDKYMLDVCQYAVTTYFNTTAKDLNIDDDDMQILINYHTCEFFGQIIRWLNGGMKENVLEQLHRFCEISKSITIQFVKQCQNK